MSIQDYSRYSRSVKRRFFARLLLLVFVPMLMMSVLHVHECNSIQTCSDCAHHVSHSGHLTAVASCDYDCVLCQFLSLPFVMALAVGVGGLLLSYKVLRQNIMENAPRGVVLTKKQRGPPGFAI
ncbi:MAG: hypothetical protein IJ914_02710 [Prevotella sp.]|nr:hypothetical protein [Prevotella sp.]